MEDRTESGRKLRILTVIDEFTRECVAVETEYRMNAKFVAGTLLRLFKQRGTTAFVRSDNGPEFIAKHLMRVLATAGVTARHIEPGSPWQNGVDERFNGTLRASCSPARLRHSTADASAGSGGAWIASAGQPGGPALSNDSGGGAGGGQQQYVVLVNGGYSYQLNNNEYTGISGQILFSQGMTWASSPQDAVREAVYSSNLTETTDDTEPGVSVPWLDPAVFAFDNETYYPSTNTSSVSTPFGISYSYTIVYVDSEGRTIHPSQILLSYQFDQSSRNRPVLPAIRPPTPPATDSVTTYIPVHDGDSDGDGIPDYADGMNLFPGTSATRPDRPNPPSTPLIGGEAGQSNPVTYNDAGASYYYPVTLTLPSTYHYSPYNEDGVFDGTTNPPPLGDIEFTYDESDPNQIQVTGIPDDGEGFTLPANAPAGIVTQGLTGSFVPITITLPGYTSEPVAGSSYSLGQLGFTQNEISYFNTFGQIIATDTSVEGTNGAQLDYYTWNLYDFSGRLIHLSFTTGSTAAASRTTPSANDLISVGTPSCIARCVHAHRSWA